MNLNGKNKPEDAEKHKPPPSELANWRLSIGYLRII